MEKVSAACAMGWSIEFEKGLRSKKPGRSIESIRQIGPILQQWNTEKHLTTAVCNMFDLVPGEDRLFADTIFLRLADAFVSGDKDIRISVIKVFLSTLRYCKTKDKQASGLFSNISTVNKLELVRRVKVVLHTDCVESRALTLVLFGCWADIAKDVAEIRHAILSALLSCHVMEAKASFFAAGRFSELSDDFGSVFLERLLSLMTSPKTLPALKVAGARTFFRTGCSLVLASKSYKAGAELVPKFSEEYIVAPMLVSLSKISVKAPILISDQVGLLTSILFQKTSSAMLASVLRCLRYIVDRSACYVPDGACQSLFRMLDKPDMPPALQSEVLQILLKMIAYGLPDMLFKDINEFMKLLRYVQNATRSPFFSEKVLAFEILVCVSSKTKGMTEQILEINSENFSSGIVSGVIDQIAVLVNPLPCGNASSEVEKQLRNMLKLLLLLVMNHSDLGCFVFDKLLLLIKNMVKSHNLHVPETQNYEVHKVVDAGAKEQISSMRVVMLCIHKFLVSVLRILGDAGATTEQVVHKVQHLISFVCGSSLFDCSIHSLYALTWHSCVNRSCLISNNENSRDSVQGLVRSPTKLLACETVNLKCVENILAGGKYWSAYTAGRDAACEGAWDVANFIFQHLDTRVKSDFCRQWLKFLVQFTQSEKNVKLLLRQSSLTSPSEHVTEPCAVDSSFRATISSEYIEKLFDACIDISSSDKVLEVISLQTETLHFQRWFLALRLKVLLLLVDTLKILGNFLVCEDKMESNRKLGGTDVTEGEALFQKMKDNISSLVGVSSRFSRLTEEFDLIASSSVDMDSRSMKVISDLAFSCSLFAFITKFTDSIISHVSGNLTDNFGDCSDVIAREMVGRLWHTDAETCMDLLTFLKDYRVHERPSHVLPKFQMSKVGCISDDILTVCRSSVKEIAGLRNWSLSVQSEDTVLRAYKVAMQLLLTVVESWMHIPCRIPKYFFRLRPSIGSVLISSSAVGRKQKEILVSPGSHLALDLCIQLNNVPLDICSRFKKIHCILYCRTSFLMTRPSGEMRTGYQALDIGTTIELNKKLQSYTMKQTKEFMNDRNLHSDGEAVEACVCFETNGRTQGFSTCLLDVSSFPVGSYRIHWHAGGVDHHGAYWSFLPLSPGPQFSVKKPSSGK